MRKHKSLPNLFQSFSLIILLYFVTPIHSQSSSSESCNATTLDDFFTCYGGIKSFTDQYVDALSAFISMEDAINSGEFAEAKNILSALWSKYPEGDPIWWQAIESQNGTNIGSPYAYYGLRMMDDIINYQMLEKSDNDLKHRIKMNVVLVGCSDGLQPSTLQELYAGTGNQTTNLIDDELMASDYRIVRQSLSLFLSYVTAITKGKLEVDLNFIELTEVCLPASVSSTKPFFATADIQPAWEAIADSVKEATDWWWIMYPSHVPEGSVFDGEEFITGGMGLDYKGGPAFIIDDKWIVRKPQHLGSGKYTDIERRVYLPQWFQHEFFHHLYRMYPELRLEVSGHDWFNRNFWPSDFKGIFEPDYYAETLHKMLQNACPPMDANLLTRTNINLEQYFAELSMDDFIGKYALDNIQNQWHEAEILKQGKTYFWRNKANVQWTVVPNLTKGRFETTDDCPYPGQDFYIELARNDQGDYTSVFTGLKFLGESYKRKSNVFLGSIPVEFVLGPYFKLENGSKIELGRIMKENGLYYWESIDNDRWSLIPDWEDGSFISGDDGPFPESKFEFLFSTENCGNKVLGFIYEGEFFSAPENDKEVVPSSISTDFSSGIKVYPNPTTDKIIIKTPGTSALQVRVYDLTGRQLNYSMKNVSAEQIEVNLEREFTGISIVLIETTKGHVYRKRVIKN